ncbi:DUF3987 domain-containing protein, partial [Microcoleus sp. Pol11C1]|uniref:DUF3987 domain-containing protein n=1 Tax=unclassified Microcoleus TaxID=2642155 RepID=UPI002FD5797D
GKQNFWPHWNKAKLDRETLINAIANSTNAEGKPCKWTGVSLVSGPLSGGIMAVDFDGPLALQKYKELSGGQLPPTTKRWTSGREGHFQILLSVGPEKWEGLKQQKIELENGEKLELRWNQCSTLPPSIHPGTGKPYFWKNSGEIAEAPEFILELMREVSPSVELPKKSLEKNSIYIDIEKNLVEVLESDILPRIDAGDFYGSYIPNLKRSGTNLKGLCPFHEEKTGSFTIDPDTNLFKCFGCGVGGGPVQFLHQIKGGSGSPTGKDFAEVVRELAGKVGVQILDRKTPAQNLKSNTQNSNILKHPAAANYAEPSPVDAEEIIDRVDKLLGEDLSPTNEIIKATAAAKQIGLSPKDVRELLAVRQAEQDLDWALIESRENFQRLYQIEKTLINLHEYFPRTLATALLSKAESDRVDPVRILQTLLPVIGATLGSRVAIEVKKGARPKDSWLEYPIFYCADVGPPSSGKSATQKTLLEFLQEMQDAELERLNQALIELTQLEDAWKVMAKEEKAEKVDSDENPAIYHEKYCKPKKWLFDEASAQALTKRIADQEPHHGCLLINDELSGVFDKLDQFTGGKGGQRQFLLNAWNGPLRGGVDRVDLQASYFFRSQTLNLTGTIQPEVARRVFNTATDPDGMVSRFLPTVASLPDDFDKWSDVQVNVYDTMRGTIEKLQRYSETLLTLPPETKKVYVSYWEQLKRLYRKNLYDNPGYAYWLGKQNSYVARFAIVLHCLENLNAAELPTRVTPETMHKAVRLSQFYCSQFLLLQSKSAQQQPLEGLLLDILKFIQQSGGQISTRDLCRSRFQRIPVEGKKLTTSTAAKLLREIAAAGFGSFEEIRNKKIFTLNGQLSSTVINCHQVDDSSKPSNSKALTENCHQMTKVYVSENFDSRAENFSAALIDESDLQPVTNSKNLEDIQFCHLMTVEAETPAPQRIEVDDSLMTVDDSDDSSALNENETELLEYLHKALSEESAYFAKQVQGILKEVCAVGAADRKKVWGTLTDAEQKKITKLLAVEIPAEVGHVIESIQILTGSSDDPSEIDHLYRVYSPELIDRAAEFLGTEDKAKFSDWMAERNLAQDLSAAFCEPRRLREIAAEFSPEMVERAIARIDKGDRDMADEIRDLLV